MINLIGTIPQWITAGSLVSVLVAWWRRGVQLRGLTLQDKADKRDHYEIALERLAERLDSTEKKHDACIVANEELRGRMREVEDELTALYRILAQASVDKVLYLGDNVPESIRKAAVRAGVALQGSKQ